MRKYFDLFLTFFKIGLFTFGGGYTMIPIIEREMVYNKKWVSKDDILDVFAISGSTPGAIAVSCSTFIGYKVGGFWGALISTLSLISPSFILIIAASFFYGAFQENLYVKYAFWGIKIGVLALILKAVILMISACKRNVFTYIIMAISFMVAVFFTGLNVIFIIISCAIIGLFSTLLAKNQGGDRIK